MLNVWPPPRKVDVETEITMFDVPALKVKLVGSKKLIVPDACKVTVLAPKVSVRILLLVELIVAAVTAKPAVLRFPLVRVMPAAEPQVSASASVHPPPTPLNTIDPTIVAPLVVIVLPVVVEEKVMAPLAVHVVVPDKVKDPLTASVPVLANVIVVPVLLKLLQVNTPVKVTV